MAPSPQHDSEPKAPDKSGAAAAQPAVDHRAPPSPAPAGVQLAESKHVGGLDDGALRALLDEAITYKCPKDREGKSLLFKELLEEAEQDEEACGGGGGGGGGWRGGREAARGRRGGGRRGERLPHSGSLQDLVAAALAADVPPQRRRPHAPVSARTHHGGSLPSGVDRSFLLGEEPVRGAGGGGADYIATVRCVNPPPLTERRVSVSDAHNATEMELLNRSKIPCIPVTYTSRATLDISGGGRAHTTTTCSNQVDSGITFGCITTPAVVTSCNTTSSAPSPCASVDSKPRAGGALATGSINGLAALSRNYGGCSTADEFKKSLDENGNALQTFNSTLSGSSQHKKPRRKKSSKNETVAMSEQIDGYQGNKEISELLRFIESDAEHGRAHKHKPHDKRSGERRARDKAKLQRANSMEELSLSKLEDLTHDKGRGEPLALRKHKKERVSDGGAPDARKSERRSWGDESRAPFYHSNSEEPPSPAAPSTAAAAAPAVAARDKKKPKSSRAAEWPPEAEAPVETLEFQTVTKKKRTRKRHSPQARGGGGGGGERAGDLYRKMRPSTPERRRKSAPPSDKSSNDDDLDSVHSLPAEPTAERCAARPGSASSGGTPQASYADIARTRHNIPDLIESCNFYTDLEPLAADDAIGKKDVCRSDSAPVETRRTPPKASDDSSGPAYDAENYPALESRGPRIPPRTKETKHAEAKPTPVKSVERKPKSEEVSAAEERSAAVERREAAAEAEAAADVSAEPPDVVLAPDRRPPVILLDEASRPREMDGITFGFDINEQLLNGGEREEAPFPSSDEFPAINEKRARARCDLVRECGAEAVAVAVGGRAPLRYVPPAPLAHPHHHHLNRIVNYVGAAWEDIMKCPGGEVRYFSQ